MPQPGDFMVCAHTGGSLAARIESGIIRWGTDAPVSHAAVYVGDGMIVQAEPGGADRVPVSLHPNAVWSTDAAITQPTAAQRATIVKTALAMMGVPYGWLDIVAIAVAQRRAGRVVDPTVPLDHQPWWVRRLMSGGRVICSQLVTISWRAAGIPLCAPQPAGLVSPGDLWRALGAPKALHDPR